jgi:UDP-3-O-[3-hydroxymyristoyl] N-acetylglucosamine deacetylase/3-hydroxyacyl-[acyl-carrier-protein] dehydratase
VIVDRELNEAEIKRITNKLGISEAVILGNNGVVNNRQLHFPNEPARHKLLDVLGDLALIGVPLKAQILAARPGHASNIAFARMIRKLYEQKKLIRKYQHERKEGVVFDINAIKKILPHRYPFLLIDKIIDFKMDEKIVGVKNVTTNEPFFEGHFPGQPVMPGVLILEAMAQTGGILLLNGIENPEGKLVFFMSIDKAKFRKPVTPGDQLVFELTMINRKSKICVMAGKAFVDGNLVAEAEMMASIIERKETRTQPYDGKRAPAEAESRPDGVIA